MALTQAQVEMQKKEVAELLGEVEKLGFAKSIFFGRVRGDLLFPYPSLTDAQQHAADEAYARVKQFADTQIDAVAIDRESLIPDSVIHGLGKLGVLGMTVPTEFGGRGFNQQQYIRIMELLGGHCASTAVFVNAH